MEKEKKRALFEHTDTHIIENYHNRIGYIITFISIWIGLSSFCLRILISDKQDQLRDYILKCYFFIPQANIHCNEIRLKKNADWMESNFYLLEYSTSLVYKIICSFLIEKIICHLMLGETSTKWLLYQSFYPLIVAVFPFHNIGDDLISWRSVI